MKKALVKVLAAAIVGSFLMIGSAFAAPMSYFSTTDFTTGTNGTIDLTAYYIGDATFGIYWVDDITGTPPTVNNSLDVKFSSEVPDWGQLDWTVNGTSWDVKNFINPGAGVQNVPDLFGFYFKKNGQIFYTDPALSGSDAVTVTYAADSRYFFTQGTDKALIDIDDITPQGSSAPVPEPATMLLFGTGLVGIVGAVRRKTKK